MNQTAMQKGREDAIKKRRKAAVKRVKAYRAWLKRDVEIDKQRRNGQKAKRETMPVIPSDNDYKVAKEEGA